MRAHSAIRRPPSSPASRNKGRSADKVKAAGTMNEHVARRLKALRILKGRTQSEIGAMLGMTFQQAAKYERGISKIPPGTLWRLAEFLGVDVGYFFAEFDRSAPTPNLAAGEVETLANHRHLRLQLLGLLDNVSDRTMLRGLLSFMQAESSEAPDPSS
jgi:transcriptional regulator with XRE-family HTH domain